MNYFYVSYLISATLKNGYSQLFIRDQYLIENANFAEKTAYSLGQMHAASALALSDAHSSYWNNETVAKMIVDNIQGDYSTLKKQSIPEDKGFFGLG